MRGGRSTLRALTTWSGSMVFFESFSQISLASDATVRTNSAGGFESASEW